MDIVDKTVGPSQDDANNYLALFNYAEGNGTLIISKHASVLSLGGGITPDMLTAMLDREMQIVLLIDHGHGGALILPRSHGHDSSGIPERVQFVDAKGQVRVFELAAWLCSQRPVLLAADWRTPVAFGGAELTGSVDPEGGHEAIAYAMYGIRVEELDAGTRMDAITFKALVAA